MLDPIATVNAWLTSRVSHAVLSNTGVAALRRDDETLLVLEVPPKGDICHFSSLVTAVDAEARTSVLATALELNRFGKPLGGCWLAWDADTDSLLLCHNLRISKTDEIEFNNTIDNFLFAVDASRKTVKAVVSEVAATDMLDL